jgi:hypothetical protein
MKPPGNGFFNDAYLVYELMDTDLHQVIRSSQPLSGACVSPRAERELHGRLSCARSRVLQTTTSSTLCIRRAAARPGSMRACACSFLCADDLLSVRTSCCGV